MTTQGRRAVGGAVIAEGAAIGVLVGVDGSPPWQLVRLLAVGGLTAACWRVVDRSSPGRRAGVAFAAGCIGVAVGIGIGLPHLAKAGLHPLTVAGLVSLACGFVLAVAGGTELAGLVRGWRRVVVGMGLVVAVALTTFSLGQAVAATNVPRPSLAKATPADRGLEHREVRFETVDGVTLSGWYVPTTNGAAVALLHGAGSTRSNVLDHAEVLARHGYGVLLFDARGHGRSGGRAMDFGWYGDEDTAAAVSFLQRQPGVDLDRIAAVGMSMGGEEAIGAAAADERVRAVVAEGATNRVAADKAWLSDEFGWRGALQERLEALTYGLADVLTAAGPPIALQDAVRRAAPRPVLLIAGGDLPDEGAAGRYIQAGSPGTVELWVVPRTGHTDALRTHPKEWAARVTAFLDRALGTAS